ncbi:MAG: hypothetical protein K6U89_08400 [Chloroflexi bacterium]|nr:hypothetical protein [Chloroflexota bacterium]
MAFSVQDFRDLLRILDEHPEWKAELRRAVLADEVLELPRIVRELAEAQRRTEERLEALTARVDALTARVEELTAAQRRTEQTVQRLVIDAADLKGDLLEWKFRRRAPSILGREFRRIHALDDEEVAEIAEDAFDAGQVDGEERADLLNADAVIRARDDAGEVWLVVEVSRTVDRHDVRRVRRRAGILARTGRRTVAGVAGERFTLGAEEELRSSDVQKWTLPVARAEEAE